MAGMSPINDSFLRLFAGPSPGLRIKFRESDVDSKIVRVQHRLGPKPTAQSSDFLDSLCVHNGAREFCEFYRQHDGAEVCRTFDTRHQEDRPLIQMMPAARITAFTSRYMPEGDLSWIMDLNKSKTLYRTTSPWIAFAEIESGPCCLTMFLDGENAGRIFYAAPQPPFNILRPIARDFSGLRDRIARDLPAFLRLVRANVTVRGSDGDYYGYIPVEYFADREQAVAEA